MSRSEGQNSGLAQSGLWVEQFGGSRFACMAYVGSYGLGLSVGMVFGHRSPSQAPQVICVSYAKSSNLCFMRGSNQ